MPANGTDKPQTTKVIRIYRGPGHFDVALADKLRPMLAKAFPSSGTDLVKSAPSTAATVKAASQGKLPLAVHL